MALVCPGTHTVRDRFRWWRALLQFCREVLRLENAPSACRTVSATRAAGCEGVDQTMKSRQRKMQWAGVLAALMTLALAVSCKGFFVDPTLTGVAVGPSGLNLSVQQTFQMVATGSYNDGSQKTLTSGVVWSSDTPTSATVGQTSGIVTGVQPGSANITASSGGCSACSGSTQVKVVLTGVTSITLTPGSQSVTKGGNPVYFTATAAPGAVDITSTANWNILDSSNVNQNANFTIQFVSGLGEEFVPSTTATSGDYKVEASYAGTTVTGTATLHVN